MQKRNSGLVYMCIMHILLSAMPRVWHFNTQSYYVLTYLHIDLLKVPPGFSEGLKIDTPAEVVNQEPVAITDLLFSDDSSVLSWTSQETPQEVVQVCTLCISTHVYL